MKISATVGVLGLSILAVACGGSGSGDLSGGRTNGDLAQSLSDVVGVWDASYQEDGLTDELYWEIDEDGNMSLFDYDGDSFDAGENCYFVLNDVIQIEYAGSGRFTVVDSDDGDTDEVEISIANGSLQIEPFIDGESIAPVETWPASSVSRADAEALDCFNLPTNIEKVSAPGYMNKSILLY